MFRRMYGVLPCALYYSMDMALVSVAIRHGCGALFAIVEKCFRLLGAYGWMLDIGHMY